MIKLKSFDNINLLKNDEGLYYICDELSYFYNFDEENRFQWGIEPVSFNKSDAEKNFNKIIDRISPIICYHPQSDTYYIFDHYRWRYLLSYDYNDKEFECTNNFENRIKFGDETSATNVLTIMNKILYCDHTLEENDKPLKSILEDLIDLVLSDVEQSLAKDIRDKFKNNLDKL